MAISFARAYTDPRTLPVAGPSSFILLIIAGVMGYWYAWIVLAVVLVVGIAYRLRRRS
jgi:hypothetical protein